MADDTTPATFLARVAALSFAQTVNGVTWRTSSGKQVIFGWFENKKAALSWYYSDLHQGLANQFFPSRPAGRTPMTDVPDDAPVLAIASLIERVNVSRGDVILLYTGRWKRRATLGPWKSAEGWAGYHADVAYFLKERGVAFIGGDAINDVAPSGLPTTVPGTPVPTGKSICQ